MYLQFLSLCKCVNVVTCRVPGMRADTTEDESARDGPRETVS